MQVWNRRKTGSGDTAKMRLAEGLREAPAHVHSGGWTEARLPSGAPHPGGEWMALYILPDEAVEAGFGVSFEVLAGRGE